MPDELSHFDTSGASRMVDVGGKPETERTARASGEVGMKPETSALIRDERLAKGELGCQIPIKSNDEIGDLAQSFNDMSGRLLVAQAEITAWAFGLMWLGLILRPNDAIYFCANAYTTLGYGTVDLDPQWRNISPIIAISGLFTFAWTTSSLVSVVATTPLVLVANPALGVTNLQQLIERAKAQPGKINYGSAGNGTVLHLAGVLLLTNAGVDMKHVPYKGFSTMLSDLPLASVWRRITSASPVTPFTFAAAL